MFSTPLFRRFSNVALETIFKPLGRGGGEEMRERREGGRGWVFREIKVKWIKALVLVRIASDSFVPCNPTVGKGRS